MLLVTGTMCFHGGWANDFVQNFFLDRFEAGEQYFVMNDILRFTGLRTSRDQPDDTTREDEHSRTWAQRLVPHELELGTSQPENADVSIGERRVSALHIKGMTADISHQDLQDHFSKFGELRSIDIKDSKDFAFIEFADPSSASCALETRTLDIHGAVLTVEPRYSRAWLNGTRNRGKGRGGRFLGSKGKSRRVRRVYDS